MWFGGELGYAVGERLLNGINWEDSWHCRGWGEDTLIAEDLKNHVLNFEIIGRESGQSERLPSKRICVCFQRWVGQNIPRAVKRIWIRMCAPIIIPLFSQIEWTAAIRFLFYVLGVFIAGLIVPYNHGNLWPVDSSNPKQYISSSPFIIAIETAGWIGVRVSLIITFLGLDFNVNAILQLKYIIIALFMLSAWSAATSDGECMPTRTQKWTNPVLKLPCFSLHFKPVHVLFGQARSCATVPRNLDLT